MKIQKLYYIGCPKSPVPNLHRRKIIDETNENIYSALRVIMFKMLSANGVAYIHPFNRMQTDSANQIPVLSEVYEYMFDEIAEMGNVV